MLRCAFVALVVSLLAAAPATYDFDDTEWSFPEAKLRVAGKAKGVGKVAAKGTGAGGITLNGDGTWTLVEEEQAIATGTWSVHPVKSKRLELELDPAGAELLRAFVSELLEDIAQSKGVTIAVDLDEVTNAKIRLSAKPSVKQGTIRLKGAAVFKFSGTTDGSSLGKSPNATTKAVYALKALSAALPLDSVLVPEGGHQH